MPRILDAFQSIRLAETPEAMNTAVGEIRSFAYTFACTQLRLPHDRADEVASDTAAKAVAVASAKTFDDETSATKYLKSIIRSRASDAERSARRRRKHEAAEGQDIVASASDRDSSSRFVDGEILREIRANGRAVHGTTRISAFMAFKLGWISLSTAAQRVGRSKSLVGRQFSRILAWVRTTFGGRI